MGAYYAYIPIKSSFGYAVTLMANATIYLVAIKQIVVYAQHDSGFIHTVPPIDFWSSKDSIAPYPCQFLQV